MKKLLFLMVVLAMLVSLVIPVAAAASGPVSTSSATITTDKTKYSVGETMIISGSGFTPVSTVNIQVQLPGNNGLDSLSASADAAGSFLTIYNPPMIPGRYKITATDSVNAARTAATEADATNEDFYGWNMSSRGVYPTWPGDWTKGDLGKNWREGDWVSYVFILNGYDGAPLPNGFKIRYDFLQASSGSILVDLARNFSYKFRDPYSGSGIPTDVTPANFQIWRDATFTPSQINIPCAGDGTPITPDDQTNPSSFAYFTLDSSAFGTIPTGKSLVIYFELHLARTFVWSNGLESLYNTAPYNAWGGARYTSWTTNVWLGSGFVTGSSGHANEIGGGAKTVPIPVPPKPAGVVSGYKWQDNNADGIWDATEPALSGWRIFIYGTGDDSIFHDEMLTDSLGAYSFPNLTEGTWLIKEASQREVPATTGWQQSYPVVGSTQGSGTGIAVSPPPADVSGRGWSVVLTEASPTQGNLNFGNYRYGSLTIKKYDVGKTNLLAGATFTVDPNPYGASPAILTVKDGGANDADATENGIIVLNNVPMGTYTITETIAPAGYALPVDPHQVVSVTVGNLNVTVEFEDPLGSLTINKWNVGETLKLGGATFTITPNPFTRTGVLTVTDGGANDPDTTANGVIALTNVMLGAYHVCETVAPAGHELPVTPCQDVTVTQANQNITVNFENPAPGTKLTIEASAPKIEVNGTVTLTIKEQNHGDVPLSDVYIVLGAPINDTIDCNSDSFVDASDTGSDCILGVGETWIWNYPYVVTTAATFTATGHGTTPSGNDVTWCDPNLPTPPKTFCDDGERASVPVDIANPGTKVTVTPFVTETVAGENVNLTITEANTGDVGLTNPYVVLTYDSTTVTLDKTHYYVSGDTDNDGVLDGSDTVAETWTWSYDVIINVTTEFTVTGHGTAPGGTDITYPFQTSEQAKATVPVGGATRTWGFWKTHLYLVNYMLDNIVTSPIDMGTWKNYSGVLQTHVIGIGNECAYMGLMWADQSKDANGKMRLAIDQARIHTAHQALAAIMNSYMPGGAALPDGITLASIADTLTNGTIQQIRDLGSALGGYNESGDDQALDSSLPPTGKTSGNIGDPQGARLAGANCLTYWDSPPDTSKGKK